jgi:hypothetical protein
VSDEPLAGAYAPPTAELNSGLFPPPPSEEPLRLLGTMFIVRATFAIVQKVIAMSRGAPASPLVWAFAIVRGLLGVGLRRRGARFRWIALFADLAEVVIILVLSFRSIPASLAGSAFYIFGPQVLSAATKLAPTLLLVIGRPGRGRIRAARVLFGIVVVLGLAGTFAVLRAAMR